VRQLNSWAKQGRFKVCRGEERKPLRIGRKTALYAGAGLFLRKALDVLGELFSGQLRGESFTTAFYTS
jgi:hypothetical protein